MNYSQEPRQVLAKGVRALRHDSIVVLMKQPRISTLGGIAASDYGCMVDNLGIPHRAKESYRRLMDAGNSALPAMRNGLRHDRDEVRVACCRLLDHFMDVTALPRLIDNLKHTNPRVRGAAMHALACDRCKEGACRPAEKEVLPIALDMLLHDPHRQVRQMAADLLGPSVHRSADVLEALEIAHESDRNATVRKVAGWWVPGGVRHTKTLKKERPGRQLSA